MNSKSLILIIAIIAIYFQSCSQSYNPSKPYPELNVGTYWIDKFDQRGLQHAKVISDKLFCNTINSYKAQDYLYCLSLKSGKVIWKVAIESHASQSVEIYKDEIYFSTYKGEVYKLSIDGDILWKIKFPSSYAGHKINPINGNLIVNSVVNGVYEFDNKTGKEIYHYNFKSKNGFERLTEPLFYENQIIFGNFEIDSINNMKGIVGIDYLDKKNIWTYILEKKIQRRRGKSMFLIDNNIIILDEENNLHCIDIKTNKRIWLKKILNEKTNKNWSLRFKTEPDKLVYHKGKVIALDIKSGKEVEYHNNENLITYEILKDNELYKIIITDKVEISGLEINIEKK